MTPEQIQSLLDALAPLDSPFLLTPDERVALDVVRKALLDMQQGGDISPEIEGVLPHKLRLWTRVSVAYFHPASPRTVTAPPLKPPT